MCASGWAWASSPAWPSSRKLDADLALVDASHLFPIHTTWIGFRRGTLLRNYAYDFMQLFGPHLTRRLIEHAIEARDPESKAEMLGRLQLPVR